jgi:hypothetical protein
MKNKKFLLNIILLVYFILNSISCELDEQNDVHPTIVPGANLTSKLDWLVKNARSDNVYTIEVSSDENINPTTLFYEGRKNIGITIISTTDEERIIGLLNNGSLFTINDSIVLTLENNITLQGRSGNNYSLVRLNNKDSVFIMKTGSRIRGNSSNSSVGGGVYISNGTLNINGGIISNNYSGIGGGVYLDNGILNINEGQISNNSASTSGGVFIGNGTLNINGGKISNNYASHASIRTEGGGVFIGNNGKLIMNGGEISGNSAMWGGGVFVSNNGTFSLINGKISNNNVTINGGGVCLLNGSFTMSGGEISNNSAFSYTYTTNGGGVYVNSGTFIMNGGKILGNSVFSQNTAFGGGVFIVYGIFSKNNGGTIYGNNSNDTINSNVVRTYIYSLDQDRRGHAVYVSQGTVGTALKRKETTAGPDMILTFDNNNFSSPIYSGEWDF